jgi:esterase/lipase superfamily enzyme
MNVENNVLADAYEDVDIEVGKKRAPLQLSLSVDGWMPAKVKEVLVFFPGFNCSLKAALENFGQLIAMTKLDSHVYPILFNWPCGQILTYHSASRVSLADRNLHNFCQFLKGLQRAGVRNVHLMSHSMGVQTLVGAMVDKEDGSRSDCSLCFQLAPLCDDMSRGEITEENDCENNLLVCRTVTLLNPDFPLVPFQEHAFRSVRRICKTVTVLGDKNDGALFFSQTVNGVAVRFGYKQPARLLPNDANKKHLKELLTVGRCIDSLYFPEDIAIRNGIENRHYLLFREVAPLLLRSTDEQIEEKLWMDLGQSTFKR